MVRCVNCAELERSTRKCKYQSKKAGKTVTISKKDIHKQIPCKGYKPKYGRKRKHHVMAFAHGKLKEGLKG